MLMIFMIERVKQEKHAKVFSDFRSKLAMAHMDLSLNSKKQYEP